MNHLKDYQSSESEQSKLIWYLGRDMYMKSQLIYHPVPNTKVSTPYYLGKYPTQDAVPTLGAQEYPVAAIVPGTYDTYPFAFPSR